jgi:hypothetical protein
MFTQRFLVSAFVLGCFCACPVSASLTTYCSVNLCTDQSNPPTSFAAATTADTFSNITFAQGNLGTSTSDLGVVFSTNGTGLTGMTNLSSWPAGSALVSNPGVNTLTITLPTAVSAVDFYLGPQDFSAFTISITDSNGATYTDGYFNESATLVPYFFGVTTDGSFTSFTITSQASPDKLSIDDMQIGSQETETPEVATLLLVATGLFLMGGARRWMPRAQAA